MKVGYAFLGLVLVTVVAGDALGQASRTPSSRPTGYLSENQLPDLKRVMPSAPGNDDARDIADRSIFRSTRSLQGSARWSIAQSDDNVTNAGLMKAFRCTIGVELNNQNAPRTMSFVSRVFADTNRAVGPLKNIFQRKRPFLVDDGPIRVLRSTGLTNSFDYPSGHSTAGWALGLVLSSLVPEQSTEILLRAHAFGESRVICGVHNASAVEAGRFGATAVYASLYGSAAFRADLEAASEELAALRKDRPPTPESCRAEAIALETKPY